MAKKSYRVIAPDRYLSVRDEPARVTVRVDEDVVARSARAVWLKEGERPEVLYVPRDDVAARRLVASDTAFECRWKGRARYFHVDLIDRTLEDVVWGYPDAPDGVAALRDRVSFDTSAFAVDIDGDGDGDGAASERDAHERSASGERGEDDGAHRNAAATRHGIAFDTRREA